MIHPQIVRTCREMHAFVSSARARGQRVGIVPTMGALHAGHLSLVEASRRECDVTVATIFVNPTQFAAHEDLGKYPRTFDADISKLAELDVAAVFAPSNDEIYPQGFSTYIQPPSVAAPLEGVCRPDHFRGVATIVLKLFNVAPAHAAFFGQKDLQQSLVVRRMVADLNVPIEIRVCPIVREQDGLAMSSRNVYISPEGRQQALSLSRALRRADEMVRGGEKDTVRLQAAMLDTLQSGGVSSIDYAAIVDGETLSPIAKVVDGAAALIAAHVGLTRLIDNLIWPSITN